MDTDHDNVILIDGYEGTGKSTIALHLLDEITPEWTVEDNVIFEWRDGRSKLTDLPRKQALLMDEGANLLFSRDAMSRNNRWFGKLLFQCRQLNNTLILCIPNKRWLDSIGREHRAQYWVHNHERGRATVLERRENWYQGTVFYVSAFEVGYEKYDGPNVSRYLAAKSEAMKRLGETEAPPEQRSKEELLRENAELLEAYT